MSMVGVQVRVPQASVLPGVGAGDTPSLDLNFLSGSLDSRVTFTRASAATYVNSAGLIASASTNIPRFDYDPVTLAIRGLLIEEARTNLMLQSEAVSTSPWVAPLDMTVTTDATAVPDGASTADKCVPNAVAAPHVLQQSVTTTAASHTFTFFVKASGYSKVGFRENTSTGAYAVIQASGAGSVLETSSTTATIADAGSGWYRVAITWTATAGARTHAIYVMNDGYSSGSPHLYASAGDTVSGVYIWGAQVEAGAFATSYIPTAGSTVTRAVDYPLITSIADFYGGAAGVTMLAETTTNASGGTSRCCAGFDDGTPANRFELRTAATSGGTVGLLVIASSVVLNAPATSATQALKLIAATDASSAVATYGGVSPGSPVATGSSPAFTRLGVGCRAGSSESLNGTIRRLRVWPKRLSNAQLQALTA